MTGVGCAEGAWLLAGESPEASGPPGTLESSDVFSLASSATSFCSSGSTLAPTSDIPLTSLTTGVTWQKDSDSELH